MAEANPLLDVLLKEYDKIKSEQTSRIAFRDNLIYVTLSVYGVVTGFAIKDNDIALLVLPWVSLALGWGYLINDHKISAIGKYVRLDLSEKAAGLIGTARAEDLFGWETAHRSDDRRRRRKVEQLVMDEVIFVIPGLIALYAFNVANANPLLALRVLSGVEAIFLIFLGIEIILYADLKRGR